MVDDPSLDLEREEKFQGPDIDGAIRGRWVILVIPVVDIDPPVAIIEQARRKIQAIDPQILNDRADGIPQTQVKVVGLAKGGQKQPLELLRHAADIPDVVGDGS